MINQTKLRNSLIFALFAVPSVSLADDSALVQGLIGGILQTMTQQGQQAQQRPIYNGNRAPFRVQDQDAERLNFRQEIQRRLNILGYNAGYPDGHFGPQSRSAIASFQTSIGHSPTGKITEGEIAILYDKTNGSPAGLTTQQDASTPQPPASPQLQETQQGSAPLTLAPVATLEPSVPAPSPTTTAAAKSLSPVTSNPSQDGATISIQPSIALPPSN